MDKVVFDGVEYVKASVIAKQFRYTADYVGQLCRGKKIDARLVGRTWFVNPLSLKEHQHGRHQAKTAVVAQESTSETSADMSSKIKSPLKVRIHPQIARATIVPKNPVITDDAAMQFGDKRRLFVYYEQDDESLLPTLHKKREISPRTIRIEHATGKRLAIAGGSKKGTDFIASDLPDVALSGALSITDYGDEAVVDEGGGAEPRVASEAPKAIQNKLISDKRDSYNTEEKGIKQVIINAPVNQLRNSAGNTKKVTTPFVAINQKSVHFNQSPLPGVKKSLTTTTASNATVASFSPRSVQRLPQQISTAVLVSPLIATLVACVCVAFILLASVSVTVTDSVYESRVVIQMANLLALFKY